MPILTTLRNGLAIKRVYLTRKYYVSAGVLFEAWSNETILKQWWGPHGFTNPVCIVDSKPGGRITIYMKAPDGMIFPLHGMFYEVFAPTRLVFATSAFEDGYGNSAFDNLNTVLFTAGHGYTLLSLDAQVTKSTPEADEALADMEESWQQSLDKLDELLKGQILC